MSFTPHNPKYAHVERKVLKKTGKAMSSEEVRALATRISKYVSLKECGMNIDCIEEKLRQHTRFKVLADHNFAWRLWLDVWLNPHPIYKEILGLRDDEYQDLEDLRDEEDKQRKRIKN